MNGTGLVEGIIPGNTTVTGQAQERDPITNNIVIFSEVYSNLLIHHVITIVTGHSNSTSSTINRC